MAGGTVRQSQYLLYEKDMLFESRLREDARKWLKLYGSGVIDGLAFRDSFIMIGQKGLKEGHAIEYVRCAGFLFFPFFFFCLA